MQIKNAFDRKIKASLYAFGYIKNEIPFPKKHLFLNFKNSIKKVY